MLFILWLAIKKVGYGFEVNDLVMIAGFYYRILLAIFQFVFLESGILPNR
jgi:hypothetical protein